MGSTNPNWINTPPPAPATGDWRNRGNPNPDPGSSGFSADFGPINGVTDNIPIIGPALRNAREEESREKERRAKIAALNNLRTMRNDWGRQQGENWKWRGDRARGEYDQAGNIARGNPYQNAPKYRQNFYKGYNPQPSRSSTLYSQYPSNQPTQLQDLNKSLGGGTKKYTRSYADSLAANGRPGPSKSSQFYTQMQTEDPSKDLNSYADESAKWSTGIPSGIRDRANESRQTYGRADELDKDLEDLKRFSPHGTETASWNRTFNRDIGSASQNAFARRLQGPQSETGSLLADLVAGNTNRGGLLKDIASRGTEGGKFLSALEGGDTASARMQKEIGGVDFAKSAGEFNRTYDPNSLEGLRDTYKKISGEGPTYEEDFYTSQLTGDNPAYNQLKQDATRDAQRSAAARGGFVSGKSIDMENRTQARLAADEFARRGELASLAGNSRRDRLGMQLGAATALDSQLGNNQGLRLEGSKAADAGTGRKYDLLSGLATTQDALRGSQSTALDTLRAGAAGGADDQRGDISKMRERLVGDTAIGIDSSNMSAAELALKGVGQQDDQTFNYRQLRSGQAKGVSQRDDNRTLALNDLASAEEAAALGRRGHGLSARTQQAAGKRNWFESLGGFASTADTQDLAQQNHYLDAMGRASDEETNDWNTRLNIGTGASNEGRGNLRDLAALGKAADDYDLDKSKFRWDMAGGAGDEYNQDIANDFDRNMQLGNARNGVNRFYDQGELNNAEDTAMDEIGLVGQGYGVDTSRYGDKRAGDRDAGAQTKQDIKDGIAAYIGGMNGGGAAGAAAGYAGIPGPSKAATLAPSPTVKKSGGEGLSSLGYKVEDEAPPPSRAPRKQGSLSDLKIGDRKSSNQNRVVSKSSKRRTRGIA